MRKCSLEWRQTQNNLMNGSNAGDGWDAGSAEATWSLMKMLMDGSGLEEHVASAAPTPNCWFPFFLFPRLLSCDGAVSMNSFTATIHLGLFNFFPFFCFFFVFFYAAVVVLTKTFHIYSLVMRDSGFPLPGQPSHLCERKPNDSKKSGRHEIKPLFGDKDRTEGETRWEEWMWSGLQLRLIDLIAIWCWKVMDDSSMETFHEINKFSTGADRVEEHGNVPALKRSRRIIGQRSAFFEINISTAREFMWSSSSMWRNSTWSPEYAVQWRRSSCLLSTRGLQSVFSKKKNPILF